MLKYQNAHTVLTGTYQVYIRMCSAEIPESEGKYRMEQPRHQLSFVDVTRHTTSANHNSNPKLKNLSIDY